MIAIVADLALGVFGVGCASLFYIGFMASVDSRHLTSVRAARQARKGRRV